MSTNIQRTLKIEYRREVEKILNDIDSLTIKLDKLSVSDDKEDETLTERLLRIKKILKKSGKPQDISTLSTLIRIKKVYKLLLKRTVEEEILYNNEKYITFTCRNNEISKLHKSSLDIIAKLYANNILSFPWKGSFLDAEQLIENCKNFRPKSDNIVRIPSISRFKSIDNKRVPLFDLSSILNFLDGEDDYERIDCLTDVFTEKARLSALRKDMKSTVLSEWNNPEFVGNILRKCLEKYKRIDPETMRETIYQECKECTQFKISLAIGIIREYKSRRILDFSAGWGDRLIAAVGCNVDRYLGFDPNIELKEGHANILKIIVNEDLTSNFAVRYRPFEEIKSISETFDLVFTSPPPFNLEKYNDADNQSINKYPKYEDWMISFLYKSCRTAWEALENNGKMVIHLKDIRGFLLCEPFCLYCIGFLPNCFYDGVICSVGSRGLNRPLWVFSKRENEDNPLQKFALSEFKRLFPKIFNKL